MRNILLLLSFLFISYESAAAFPNMIVEHYTTENGLINNIVNCSLKDKDGFIWFGTWYGLCSFDGTRFKTYNNRNNTYSDVPPQKVQRIIEDRNGYLWLKTIDRKLYIFDKTYELFHSVHNDLKEHSENTLIAKVELTSEGDLLLLTMNKTLLRAYAESNGKIHIEKLYDGKLTNYQPQNILCETSDYISWISKDNLVITSHRKGKSLQTKPTDYITQQLSPGENHKYTCISENGNQLWLGDEHGRIYSISPETGTVQLYTIPGIQSTIRSLIARKSGILYISTDQGIYEYNVGYDQQQKLSLPLSGKDVSVTLIDKYDKIWFQEGNHALVYYDPFNKESHRFNYSNTLKVGDFEVQDMGEQGIFFLTAAGELFHFDRKTQAFNLLNNHKSFDDNQGKQLFLNLMTDDNILWISSTTNGVYQVNFPKKQFHELPHILSLPPNVNPTDGRSAGVRTLFQAKNGDIWIGTRWQEVIRMNHRGEIIEVFNNKNFKFGSVYHIMEDASGNLWFSTKGDGLVLAQPDILATHGFRFTRYKNDEENPNSISNNDVCYTFQDSKQRIWVATLGGGLNLLRFNNHNTSFIHQQNGLSTYPSHGLYMEVRALTEDKEGRIWIGTMDGLMSFDGNIEHPEQIEFETYRESNANLPVTVNDIYTLYKDSQSQIWISVFGGGLHKMIGYDRNEHQPVFHSYGLREGMSNEVARAIAEDKEGNLWMASENGISCFNKQTQRFRNYSRYDGFPNVKLQENSILCTQDGTLWLGGNQEIIFFQPKQLEISPSVYNTFIVDFKVSNRPLADYQPTTAPNKSIKHIDRIELAYNQSMFTIEFAALNYHNPDNTSYRYILQGYENEWHYNNQNRIASYTNVPPGNYVFRVETLDEFGSGTVSFTQLPIVILPPWWKTWWAYTLYILLSIAALYLAIRLILFFFKMKNDVYIEQQLAEMKIKFFTNISHELRTPLTLIEGPIEELKSRESFSGKSLQYIELMEKNVKQMLQLVNQILDLRKIQNKKMRLHVSQVNLHATIKTLHNEFRLLAEEKGIHFVFDLPEKEILLWADKDKLTIVLRNILTNAFKYTQEDGTVIVSTGISTDADRCFIRIANNGAGIPPNMLNKIFERFAQVHTTQNDSQPGTGIGLALSKEIVSLHHGDIKAESPGQQGAIFTIELYTGKEHFNLSDVDFYADDNDWEDTNQSSENAPVTDEEGINNSSSLPSLLLIDDNKDLRKLISMEFEEKFNVYTAGNGVEGLRKIYLYNPDIIITDQMMPGMDGIELLKRIRNDFQISHIPVIMLTARNDEDIKTQAISLGANSYITKPFSKEYLLVRIEQLLKERKLFQDRIQQSADSVQQDSYEKFLANKDTQLLEKIKQVIEDNMDNSDFNIDTIANNIGLSRSAFFKKLKSLTGLAPVDLVKELRLSKSVELIKSTDMSIAEIAFAVGFKDSSYYSKCFRKKYGLTPREYINQWRKSDTTNSNK